MPLIFFLTLDRLLILLLFISTNVFIYLLLVTLGFHWCAHFSLAVGSRGHSLLEHRLLIAVASLVEHGL